MRRDPPDEGATRELVAEMRAIMEETHRAIAASQAILDRCASTRPGIEDEPNAPEREAPCPLGSISDNLLQAYALAKRDGDPVTLALIEQALFQVGRRLARSLSPAEAGLLCH